MIIYAPILSEFKWFDSSAVANLEEFKHVSDVIVSNGYTDDLTEVEEEIYTRDSFGHN